MPRLLLATLSVLLGTLTAVHLLQVCLPAIAYDLHVCSLREKQQEHTSERDSLRVAGIGQRYLVPRSTVVCNSTLN
jgi:hypothetical protein